MERTLTVAEVMSPKPIALHPADSLERAAREMHDAWIRHLPIVDRHGALVGLLSQRDLLAGGDLGGRVADLMRTDVTTVAPETAAHEAAYLMLRHKIGCVPVTGPGGLLLGIVTESDFVRLAYRLLGGTVPVAQLEFEEHESERL